MIVLIGCRSQMSLQYQFMKNKNNPQLEITALSSHIDILIVTAKVKVM